MIDDRKAIKPQPRELIHNIILENKSKLSISGVTDVESFDEESIVIHTENDTLTVKGFNLHINKLNLDASELVIEGEIENLTYADLAEQKGGGFFSKMFR